MLLRIQVIKILKEASEIWEVIPSYLFTQLERIESPQEFEEAVKSIIEEYRDLYYILYKESEIRLKKMKLEPRKLPSLVGEPSNEESDFYYDFAFRHEILETYLLNESTVIV